MHSDGYQESPRPDTPTDPAVSLTGLIDTHPDFSLPAPERRAGRRLRCRVWTECHPLERQGAAAHWPGTVSDLSERGLRLFLERRFERGTLLVVEFPGSAGHAPQAHVARVTWLAPHHPGHWVLGCAFPCHLDRAYLLALTG
jgi:hypothetical protein